MQSQHTGVSQFMPPMPGVSNDTGVMSNLSKLASFGTKDTGKPSGVGYDAFAKKFAEQYGLTKDSGMSKLGELLGNVGTGVDILSGISSIILGAKGIGIARDNLNMQRGFANANLKNSTQAYNTHLADKARARFFTEGGSQADADNYVKANQLDFKRI